MRSEAWRPAAAACNRSSREARDPALQALRPGCEELAVTNPAQMPVRQARPRSLKPPRWSAERRASRVMGRKAPRKRLACRVMCTPNGCRCTRTFLGAPPTLIRGERSKVANPGRRTAPRERDWLFDIVSCEVRDARPHPEERTRRRRSANFERACARLEGLILRSARVEDVRQTSNARARVSKDEAEQVHAPSCFETRRSGAMTGRSSARSRGDAPRPETRG